MRFLVKGDTKARQGLGWRWRFPSEAVRLRGSGLVGLEPVDCTKRQVRRVSLPTWSRSAMSRQR